MNKKARVIAFYLPQFHPILENDTWWGKGFTEWTNVAKAKPLFKGHYQPRIPADLGFYDLRLPEVREAQANMARDAGIEGFCYWHYWFGNGKQLLERPFNEVLESGKPDFPFCLGWANHSWTNKSWEKGSSKISEMTLMEQTYCKEDYDIHFYEVLKAFKDPRYIKVDGKPLFVIYDSNTLPDDFIPQWRSLAAKNGLKGIHFVGITGNLVSFDIDDKGKKHYRRIKTDTSANEAYEKVLAKGFDAVNSRGQLRAELSVKGRVYQYAVKALEVYFNINVLKKFGYEDIIKYLYLKEDTLEYVYPTLLPNWDRSARSGKKAIIYHRATPTLFERHLREGIALVSEKDPEHRILFLMSWNEWAEGNYVEPDLKYGHGWLDVLKRNLI
jgi:lipopolysaccharide biosynthesis protein